MGLRCQRELGFPAPTLALGRRGRRRSGSQHAGEDRRSKCEGAEQDHHLQKFLALRIGLLPTRRRCPLMFRQKLNQSAADGQMVR